MKSKLKFNKRDLDNVEKILKNLSIVVKNASDNRLNRAAAEMTKEIKLGSPVDKGDLKKTTHYEKTSKGVFIESPMDYASFVEFGTSKQKPNPYFFNPIRVRFRKFVDDLRRKVNKEIKKSS
jgi:HK97 gp10 family phage protein